VGLGGARAQRNAGTAPAPHVSVPGRGGLHGWWAGGFLFVSAMHGIGQARGGGGVGVSSARVMLGRGAAERIGRRCAYVRGVWTEPAPRKREGAGAGGASAFCSVILARAHAWNLEAPRRGRQLLLRSVSVCSYGPCTTSHGTDRFVVVQVPSICMCSIHAECAANAAGSKIRLGAGNSTSLRTFSGDPTCN
jgi:hypothetical protein